MEDDRTRALLGSQLATARRDKGWTLEQVARRTGGAGPRLSEMETGKANSTIDTLEAVGRLLPEELVLPVSPRWQCALGGASRLEQAGSAATFPAVHNHRGPT